MSEVKAKSGAKNDSNFRQDLVGLRGVAVLAVLLHHFEIPGFIGAFYGPDIFFVLSGFLITGSLVREYGRSLKSGTGKGSISFIGLYLRRARRIIPAATLVIVAINIYSYFFINEIRQRTIFVDSVWTFFFGANIRFLKEATDYFSTDGISPLVHFWSLSVTEQFYVFWPLLLLVAARIRIPGMSKKEGAWKRQMIFALSILIAVSFVWSLLVFGESANRAYFSTFCRAWELAVGGAIAILVFPEVTGKSQKVVSFARNLSLVLLFGSVFIVTPENFGYTIFIPVLACAFIIFSGRDFMNDLSSKTLGSLPLKNLGTISYSVYLWHWPVFVFAHNLGWMHSLTNKALGISLTLLLGTATYFLVEKTFMRIPIPKDSKFANENLTKAQLVLKRLVAGGSIALVALLVSYVFLKPQIAYRLHGSSNTKYNIRTVNEEFNANYGVKSQPVAESDWPAQVEAGAQLGSMPNNLASPFLLLEKPVHWKGHGFDCMEITKRNSKDCALGSRQSNQDPEAPKVIILGSSFAEALVPAIARVFDPTKYNLRGYIMPMCSIAEVQNLKKDGSLFTECLNYRPWAFEQILNLKPDYIFMSSNARTMMRNPPSEFQEKLELSLRKLKTSGANLILVGTMPATGNLPTCLVGKSKLGEDCFTNPNTDQSRRDAESGAIKNVGGVYLDPRVWICTRTICPPIINNMIVSWDGAHLTTWFSQFVGRFIENALVRAQVLTK